MSLSFVVYPVQGFHLCVDERRTGILIGGQARGLFSSLRRELSLLHMDPHQIEAVLLTCASDVCSPDLAKVQGWTNAVFFAAAAEWNITPSTSSGGGENPMAHIDFVFANREILPFWGGLEVLRLPKAGESAFYSAANERLFYGSHCAVSLRACSRSFRRGSWRKNAIDSGALYRQRSS